MPKVIEHHLEMQAYYLQIQKKKKKAYICVSKKWEGMNKNESTEPVRMIGLLAMWSSSLLKFL